MKNPCNYCNDDCDGCGKHDAYERWADSEINSRQSEERDPELEEQEEGVNAEDK